MVLLSGLLLSLSLGSCRPKDGADKVSIEYRSHEFYKDYMALDTQNLTVGLKKLKQQYPAFTDFFYDTFLNVEMYGDYENPPALVRELLTEKDYRDLFVEVKKQFPNLKSENQALHTAFQRMKYYDSAFVVPTDVYFFVSYLQLSALIGQTDSVLGIGLDMFLGKDFAPYYSVNLDIPEYELIRFSKENIPVWACRVIYENRFSFEPQGKRLIDLMLEKGKELYFLKKCLPDVPDRLLLGFTDEQMTWCEKNERGIYNFFLEHDLLYQRRLQDIMRYVVDGPYTPGLPPEAPGNVGTYIGWQIIEQFAQNEALDLESVLKEQNSQLILQKAQYKP